MGAEAAALALEAVRSSWRQEARTSAGEGDSDGGREEALRLAQVWAGETPDVELAWALSLARAELLGPREGLATLDASALPEVPSLWASGRRMLAVEVLFAQASLAARWGAKKVARARWRAGREYVEACMKELTKQERETMVEHLQRRAGIEESLERAFGEELEVREVRQRA